jgi:2-amino-4-hydroxy-6-hydroxymethyldihydropteridine diphosphokinase
MLQRDIFLLLGSNSGDRSGQLKLAIEFIENEIGRLLARSKVYETAPWGKADQPDFLNQALHVESLLSPIELLFKVQGIERALGRERKEKWGERSIDIDILYFDDMTIDIRGLVIPHPHLAERRFVLVPLAEISPEFVHPILQKSTQELLKECRDTLPVKEFTD